MDVAALLVLSSLVKAMPYNFKRSPAKSSETSQQNFHRRIRGRIVPGSGNQDLAAHSQATSAASGPPVSETTSAVQVQVSGNQGIAAQSQPTPASDPPVGVITSAVQVPIYPSPSGEGSSPHVSNRKELFDISKAGDVSSLRNLVREHGPDILLTVTPFGNSALHLAVMLGPDNKYFAEEVCKNAPSLLSLTNMHGQTPLIAALMARKVSLANWLIDTASHLQSNNTSDIERGNLLKEMLSKCDRAQENALHHALRNGFPELAIEIFKKERSLSEQVNKNGESAMHMACRRQYVDVVEELLKFSSSSHAGPNDQSALHAAIEAQDIGIVRRILSRCPNQASHVNAYGNTPLCTAIEMKNLEMVKILLEDQPYLAYISNKKDGYTPFLLAANLGYVDIAKEIASRCPDSAYALTKLDEMNALHEAVQWEECAFVDYILENPQFHTFINQGDRSGNLPLQYAAHTCNAKLLGSLISKRNGQDGIGDNTAVNANNVNAADVVYSKTDLFDTPKWKEAFEVASREIPSGVSQLVENEVRVVKQEVEKIKMLTEMYTGNTSVVAALLATITFAAAFTLPGGYSTDPQDAGLPIFGRETAFKVFLFSDTLAMCSSLAVAFFSGLLTWKDYNSTNESKNILLNYREWARALMWCAYASTSIAFATGLYTVLAPKCSWLAIFIVVLCSVLPILLMIFSEWPKLKVYFVPWVASSLLVERSGLHKDKIWFQIKEVFVDLFP